MSLIGLPSFSYAYQYCEKLEYHTNTFTKDTGFKGITLSWRVYNKIINEYATYKGIPLNFKNKENYKYVPLLFFGEFSGSQNQVLSLDNKTINNKLSINLYSTKNDLGTSSMGQKFILTFIPKNCDYYININ